MGGHGPGTHSPGTHGPSLAEASKLVMSYVAAVCSKGEEVDKVKEQLLQSNPVLEGKRPCLAPCARPSHPAPVPGLGTAPLDHGVTPSSPRSLWKCQDRPQ